MKTPCKSVHWFGRFTRIRRGRTKEDKNDMRFPRREIPPLEALVWAMTLGGSESVWSSLIPDAEALQRPASFHLNGLAMYFR